MDVKCLHDNQRKFCFFIRWSRKPIGLNFTIKFLADIFFSLQPSTHINEGIEIEDNEEIGMTCNQCLPSCSAEVTILSDKTKKKQK